MDERTTLNAQIRMSEVLRRAGGLQEMLAHASSAAAEILNADSVRLIRYESISNRFLPGVPGQETPGQLQHARGLAGWVVRNARSAMIADASADERFDPALEGMPDLAGGSVLAVPIKHGEDVLGVMELFRDRSRKPFRNQERELAESLAKRLASAIKSGASLKQLTDTRAREACCKALGVVGTAVKELLSGIQSSSMLLEKALDQEDIAQITRSWAMVKRNHAKLNEMILGMLSLAAEKGLKLQPCDANELIVEATEGCRDEAAAKGINLSTELAPGLEPFPADRRALLQVLTSLLGNAIQACKEKPASIKVTSSVSGENQECCDIAISDSGEGITPEQRERLFEFFYTTKGPSRIGLGLAVARKLVGMHKGEIAFRPNEDKGSTFTVRIPRSTRA